MYLTDAAATTVAKTAAADASKQARLCNQIGFRLRFYFKAAAGKNTAATLLFWFVGFGAGGGTGGPGLGGLRFVLFLGPNFACICPLVLVLGVPKQVRRGCVEVEGN